jgi:hypothetical protein
LTDTARLRVACSTHDSPASRRRVMAWIGHTDRPPEGPDHFDWDSGPEPQTPPGWAQTSETKPTESPGSKTAPLAANGQSGRKGLLTVIGALGAVAIAVIAWNIGRSGVRSEPAAPASPTETVTVAAQPSIITPTTANVSPGSDGSVPVAPLPNTDAQKARSDAYFSMLASMQVCTDNDLAPGGNRFCKATFENNDALVLGTEVCLGYKSGMDDGEITALLRRRAPINSDVAEVIRLAAKFKLC